MEDENIKSKTATLTHKVRNPQDLDQWLDIWKTDVSADFDYTNPDNVTRNAKTEKVIITPSKNWQIPAENLKEVNLSQIIVPPTTITTTTTTTDENGNEVSTEVKSTNYFIHLLKTTNTGRVVNGPILNTEHGSIDKFLNEKGEWYSPNYNLTISNSNDNLALSFNQDSQSINTIGISYSSPINVTFENSSLNFSLNKIKNEDIDTDTKIAISKLDLNAQDAIKAINNNKTVDNDGIVSYNKTNGSKVWATDKDGKPSWQDSTAQFNTKLFGAIISEEKPKLESDISIFTKFYSKNFTGFFTKTDNSKIEGTGRIRYKQEYDKVNKKLTIYLTYLYFHTDNDSDFYVWASSSDDSVNEIYNFDGTKKIISFSSLLDYYIDTYLENYLNEGISFDDFKASIDVNNSGLYKFGNELLDICTKYYENNNDLPENVNTVLWEDEFNTIKNTPYIVNEWDYNHCGIWIET